MYKWLLLYRADHLWRLILGSSPVRGSVPQLTWPHTHTKQTKKPTTSIKLQSKSLILRPLSIQVCVFRPSFVPVKYVRIYRGPLQARVPFLIIISKDPTPQPRAVAPPSSPLTTTTMHIQHCISLSLIITGTIFFKLWIRTQWLLLSLYNCPKREEKLYNVLIKLF